MNEKTKSCREMSLLNHVT